ncbi:MAG: leucine-rich repeat protein [Bacteroidales bacterium]|nr:leucine-rich repeat protein [Bacteroidales bacterium]
MPLKKITKETKFIRFNEDHLLRTESSVFPQSFFKGNDELESVIIPEGFTRILKGSFEGCSSLTSVTIPASVKLIEENAFAGCNSLKSVILDDAIIQIEHWFSPGVKTFVSRDSLVETLKKGEEVKLLTESDIDYWE